MVGNFSLFLSLRAQNRFDRFLGRWWSFKWCHMMSLDATTSERKEEFANSNYKKPHLSVHNWATCLCHHTGTRETSLLRSIYLGVSFFCTICSAKFWWGGSQANFQMTHVVDIAQPQLLSSLIFELKEKSLAGHLSSWEFTISWAHNSLFSNRSGWQRQKPDDPSAP